MRVRVNRVLDCTACDLGVYLLLHTGKGMDAAASFFISLYQFRLVPDRNVLNFQRICEINL